MSRDMVFDYFSGDLGAFERCRLEHLGLTHVEG